MALSTRSGTVDGPGIDTIWRPKRRLMPETVLPMLDRPATHIPGRTRRGPGRGDGRSAPRRWLHGRVRGLDRRRRRFDRHPGATVRRSWTSHRARHQQGSGDLRGGGGRSDLRAFGSGHAPAGGPTRTDLVRRRRRRCTPGHTDAHWLSRTGNPGGIDRNRAVLRTCAERGRSRTNTAPEPAAVGGHRRPCPRLLRRRIRPWDRVVPR